MSNEHNEYNKNNEYNEHLNPGLDKGCISDFIDDNFYLIMLFLPFLLFLLPKIFVVSPRTLGDFIVKNLEVFDFNNYFDIEDVKNSQLYEIMYFIISKNQDILFVCNYCDDSCKKEIKNFLVFLIDMAKSNRYDINLIKEYNISYESIKNLSDFVYSYYKSKGA